MLVASSGGRRGLLWGTVVSSVVNIAVIKFSMLNKSRRPWILYNNRSDRECRGPDQESVGAKSKAASLC